MFTQQERDELEEFLGGAFEVFQEPIVIYKTPDKTYVTSAASNFNFAFGDEQPAAEPVYISKSGQFFATIEYQNQKDAQQLYYASLNSNVQQPYGDIKISVSGQEAREFLESNGKIVLDGKDFRRVTDIVPRGLFNRNFFDCWLKKIDNG